CRPGVGAEKYTIVLPSAPQRQPKFVSARGVSTVALPGMVVFAYQICPGPLELLVPVLMRRQARAPSRLTSYSSGAENSLLPNLRYTYVSVCVSRLLTNRSPVNGKKVTEACTTRLPSGDTRIFMPAPAPVGSRGYVGPICTSAGALVVPAKRVEKLSN